MVMHGGALDLAILKYGGEFKDWIDLSTGINPYHYPINLQSNVIDIEDFKQLPQQKAHQDLVQVARTYYECKHAQIVLANGTQSLIEQLPLIVKKSTIAILSPTYQEHQIAWQRAGHAVVFCTSISDAKNYDHVLIVNPNNPTGQCYTPDELQALYAHLKQKNGLLILDEAFMDTEPEQSFAKNSDYDNLVIFKSFGKFFGLAGIRIGFILSNQKIADQLNEKLPLWSIAGPSLKIATMAMSDEQWPTKMIEQLDFEMQKQMAMLKGYGFEIIGEHALFCLVKPPAQISAYQWYEALCANQILVRKFEHDQTILRLGLAPKEKFARFEAVICKLSQ